MWLEDRGLEGWVWLNHLRLLSTLKGETLLSSLTHTWLPTTRAEDEDNRPAGGRSRGEGEGRHQVLLPVPLSWVQVTTLSLGS